MPQIHASRLAMNPKQVSKDLNQGIDLENEGFSRPSFNSTADKPTEYFSASTIHENSGSNSFHNNQNIIKKNNPEVDTSAEIASQSGVKGIEKFNYRVNCDISGLVNPHIA